MGLLCFPEFVCQGLKHALHFLKKNSTGGVKTAPAALQIRRRIFSPSRENPRTPDPTLTRCLSVVQVRIGPVAPQCFGYGDGRGDFFNLILKFAPTGSRTQDLRSAAGSPNRLSCMIWIDKD